MSDDMAQHGTAQHSAQAQRTDPPLAVKRFVELHPGDITYTWCSRHMDRTAHVYQPDKMRKLSCLECHPEDDPRAGNADRQSDVV